MVALVAVGVMNIPAMVGLALVAGVAALVYAAAPPSTLTSRPELVHQDQPMDMSALETEPPANLVNVTS